MVPRYVPTNMQDDEEELIDRNSEELIQEPPINFSGEEDDLMEDHEEEREHRVEDVLNDDTELMDTSGEELSSDDEDELMESEAEDEEDCPPLVEAAWYGDTERVGQLLADGADPNAHDASHTTAVMWASTFGYSGIVALLSVYGASVNLVNSKQSTALMDASRKGHVGTARLLLDMGADVDVVDIEGETALTLAILNEQDAIVSLLSENDDEEVAEGWDLMGFVTMVLAMVIMAVVLLVLTFLTAPPMPTKVLPPRRQEVVDGRRGDLVIDLLREGGISRYKPFRNDSLDAYEVGVNKAREFLDGDEGDVESHSFWWGFEQRRQRAVVCREADDFGPDAGN